MLKNVVFEVETQSQVTQGKIPKRQEAGGLR